MPPHPRCLAPGHHGVVHEARGEAPAPGGAQRRLGPPPAKSGRVRSEPSDAERSELCTASSEWQPSGLDDLTLHQVGIEPRGAEWRRAFGAKPPKEPPGFPSLFFIRQQTQVSKNGLCL